MALRAGESLVDDLHDQLVVAPAKSATHASQSGVAREVGRRVDLEDIRLAIITHPHVDPSVTFAFRQVLPCRTGNVSHTRCYLRVELGRAYRNGSFIFRAPWDPLGGVADDGPAAI